MYTRILSVVVSVMVLGVMALPVAAQGDFADFSGLTDAATPAGFNIDGATSIPIVIGRVIQYALSFVGVVLMVIISISFVTISNAGGNDEEVAKGKLWIKNAAWGALIVMAAYLLTTLVLFLLKGSIFQT